MGCLPEGPSFIVTLAGMLAFRGVLIGITNGTTVSPTSAAMSQIGQSYLSDSVGFTIGVIGLLAFVAGNGVAVCAVSRWGWPPPHQHPWWDVRH